MVASFQFAHEPNTHEGVFSRLLRTGQELVVIHQGLMNDENFADDSRLN